jgi:hypothetical protein
LAEFLNVLGRALGINQVAGVVINHLDDTLMSEGHDRKAAGHRFKDDVSGGIANAGENESQVSLHDGWDLVFIHAPKKAHVFGKPESFCLLAKLGFEGALADQS